MDNGTEGYSEEIQAPSVQMAQLLADLAQVGANLAQILSTLEDWPHWYDGTDDNRGVVIQQAYQSLLEADREIHATAAMLHLLTTGAPPPPEAIEELFPEE